ncbi:ATP-binding protein [Deinococcus sonorensis]|uniref:AAA family ATPase n=2 Tax=Deinococcus sonorensis TaxID=309891 RepID=A0AAU7U604_9DEIO
MNLLERAPSLEKLLGWWREAASGEGRLVLLAGEAGVGKTVFLREFIRRSERQAEVLVGACDPLATPRPLGPLLDIAGVLGGELERLLLETGRRDAVFRAFLSILSNARTVQIVVFEDVHWADEATLDLLRFLGRRLDRTRVLLVASYRDDEVGPTHPLRAVLGDLATCSSARRLLLSPLSQPAVGRLAEGSGIEPTELYRRTGGNPFYVTEVLASATGGVPPTVRDAVLARAARLSTPARAVLEAASVIGSRIELWLLERVLPSSLNAVDECLSVGVLHGQEDALSFRHELARQAVLESLSPQRRLQLHQRVLQVLSTAPARSIDAARLAEHAEAANDAEAVLHFARLAARRARALKAHREAGAQLSRALRQAHRLTPADHARLLGEYAEECFITDQPEEAIRAHQAALAIWQEMGDQERAGETLSHLARLFVGMGRNADAEQASRASLDLLGALAPGGALAFAYACQAHLRMLNRDNQDAIRWGQRAIELAEAHQRPSLLVLALNTVGTASLLQEDEVGRAFLERSLDLARELKLDEHVALAYRMLGSVAGELYQFPRADRYLQDGLRYCEEHDIDGHRLYMLAWQALSHAYQGRWTEATEAALAVTGRPGTSATSRIMALLALGRVRTRRGDPEVWPALDEALEMAVQTGTLQRLAPVRAARAEAAWLAGDLDRVREEAQAVYDLACEHQHPWFAGELAYWRWKADGAVPAGPGMAEPYALQLAGRWPDAAAAWDRLHCPYEAARALAEGDQEDALKLALHTFERLGARPAAVRTAQRLRERGAGGIPRGPRPSTRANAAHLTPREMEVLRLLGEALQDTEIAARLGLSAKTVGHHVSSILSKLGVRNRTEAVREATRLALLPT